MRGIPSLLIATAVLVVATPAHAGTLTFQQPGGLGGSLLFTAAPGEENRMALHPGRLGGLVIRDDGAPIALPVATAGGVVCARSDPYEVRCEHLTASRPAIHLVLGDRADTVTERDTSTSVDAGPGDDRVTMRGSARVEGGDGDDLLAISGFSYASLEGGPGDDRLSTTSPVWEDRFGAQASLAGGPGADSATTSGAAWFSFRGGPGPDRATTDGAYGTYLLWEYSDGRTTGVSATPDGIADDGAPGEGDNIPPGVEHLMGTAFADDLTAPADGAVDGLAGDDVLRTPGVPGRESFNGGDGDDTVFSRDGDADFVACVAGLDRVVADVSDYVRDCETVEYP